MHADQKLIDYLLNNDHQGISLIYKRYAKKIQRMIVHNSGSEEDGLDIFQESLVDIYHMARDKGFTLSTSFEAFVLLVCKRKWLNQLKKQASKQVTNDEDSLYRMEDDSQLLYEAHLEQVEKENVLMEVLHTLGERCQEIIKRCMVSKHQEKIAESLGVTYAYLRKKKSECMSSLGERVKNHPYFKNLGL